MYLGFHLIVLLLLLQGTQIQETMFKEATDKLWNKFELGNFYYISKGTLRVANNQIQNSSK